MDKVKSLVTVLRFMLRNKRPKNKEGEKFLPGGAQRRRPGMLLIISFIAGILMGTGLILGQMTRPERLFGFFHFKHWDPTLGIVLGVSALVSMVSFQYLVKRWSKPLFEKKFFLPTRRDVDWRILVGGALYGLGFGLCGVCLGPAFPMAGSKMTIAMVVIPAGSVGMLAYQWFDKRVLGRR